MQRDYHQGVEDRIARINELKKKIHHLKYPFLIQQNTAQNITDQMDGQYQE